MREPVRSQVDLRRGARAAALAVATLLLAAPSALGAGERQTAGGSAPSVLPVWALADGDTPLAGARVRVLSHGRPLRPVRGRGSQRTSEAGVALLDFRRLPRRFTVEVTPRHDLDGRFRAVVRRHRTGRVVHVNPVSTVIAKLATRRRGGDRIGPAVARREAYDLLRIPDWHDHADLRHSDRYFNGDAYLRAARRRDGVASLNRALVRRALDDERRAFHNPTATAAAAGPSWLALLADPEALLAQVFKSVGTLAGKTAAEVVAEKAGDTALGWMLSLFGLGGGDQLTKQDLQDIHDALDALGKQVSELKGQIDRAEFTTLVHLTDRTIGQIDYATTQLALLANVPAGEPTKAAFARTIVDYVGANLLDAPEILDRSLGANVPLSDNLIKSASRVASTRQRFFDRADSEEVRSVYAYYAAYQARLAILLAEYFHAKPEIYAPALVQEQLARLDRNVTAQAASLKPPVPAGTVVDRKSGLMWMQTIDGSTFRQISDFAEIRVDQISPQCRPPDNRFGCPIFQLTAAATATALPGLPFGNWAMPSRADLQTLVSDRNGNGVEWLVNEAHISRKVVEAPGGNSHVFFSDGFSMGQDWYDRKFLYWWLYDLKDDALSPRNTLTVGNEYAPDFVNWRKYLSQQSQPILYRRVPAPGEEYWWR